jgi:hypothetical protein
MIFSISLSDHARIDKQSLTHLLLCVFKRDGLVERRKQNQDQSFQFPLLESDFRRPSYDDVVKSDKSAG